MACWDLKGKADGQSVCALLGGLRDRVPTYASGALDAAALRSTTSPRPARVCSTWASAR